MTEDEAVDLVNAAIERAMQKADLGDARSPNVLRVTRSVWSEVLRHCARSAVDAVPPLRYRGLRVRVEHGNDALAEAVYEPELPKTGAVRLEDLPDTFPEDKPGLLWCSLLIEVQDGVDKGRQWWTTWRWLRGTWVRGTQAFVPSTRQPDSWYIPASGEPHLRRVTQKITHFHELPEAPDA